MAEPSSAGGASSRFSWVTKVLAPLALTIVVIAVVLVIESSQSGEEDGRPDRAASAKTDGSKESDKDEEPKTYVVQSGDSLSTIADEFGLTVQQLLRLNRGSGIDPQALAEGQELTVSR
jgi:LysM repeat protein